MYVDRIRFRKCTDIRRRYPILEALWDDHILFDVSASDEGIIEFAIHEAAANRIFRLEDFRRYLDEGVSKLKVEMAATDDEGT
jgi:hypothetical protein